jgi:hypothetical protein
MPVENFEPLKMIRYQKGECFMSHHDTLHRNNKGSAVCEVPYSNRVVAMFVYLNKPKSGVEPSLRDSASESNPALERA